MSNYSGSVKFGMNIVIFKNLKKIKNDFKMEKIKYLLLLLLFISCDSTFYVELIIIDSETTEPIKNVTIRELNTDFIGYSNENGYFFDTKISGPDKSKMTLIISKEKYISDTIIYKSYEQRFIKLVKAENINNLP